MRSKVNIQSRLNKSVTDSDRFLYVRTSERTSERTSVFFESNKKNRTRRFHLNAARHTAFEHSPPLYKQTHVNNVINRHLIFVKCLLEFK